MSKHTISMDEATWDAMVERAGRIGLDRDGKALSVSAYLRELHERYGQSFQFAAPGERADTLPSVDDVIGILNEQSTRTDAQPTGQGGSTKRRSKREPRQALYCLRAHCDQLPVTDQFGYCSASHRLADEQERGKK